MRLRGLEITHQIQTGLGDDSIFYEFRLDYFETHPNYIIYEIGRVTQNPLW